MSWFSSTGSKPPLRDMMLLANFMAERKLRVNFAQQELFPNPHTLEGPLAQVALRRTPS
ncbi:MAG: hypothetical protein AB8B55_04975 [Mariniblastus sp.]